MLPTEVSPLYVVVIGHVAAADWRINAISLTLANPDRPYAAIGLVVNAILDKSANFLTTESLARDLLIARQCPSTLVTKPNRKTVTFSHKAIYNHHSPNSARPAGSHPRECFSSLPRSSSNLLSEEGSSNLVPPLPAAAAVPVEPRPADISPVDFVREENLVSSLMCQALRGEKEALKDKHCAGITPVGFARSVELANFSMSKKNVTVAVAGVLFISFKTIAFIYVFKRCELIFYLAAINTLNSLWILSITYHVVFILTTNCHQLNPKSDN